jgi:hypothetical protein
MSSTDSPPQLSQECVGSHGPVVAVASEAATDGRGRNGEPSQSSGSSSCRRNDLLWRAQESEPCDYE